MSAPNQAREAGSLRAPRIWLLLGEKPGDNAQIEQIAAALGLPVERRRLWMKERWRLGKPRVRASLRHLDPVRSDPLTPPWPDLVLTVGRRLSMAALWIREQSGGSTRLALVGKPRRRLGDFDLVIASVQYQLPERPNVLRLALPLMRLDEAEVARDAERWRARLAALRRPLTAVLVGGPTKQVRLDAGVAAQLLAQVRRAPDAAQGSLYVTTSRRTPPEVADALAAALGPGDRLFRWSAEASENPYRALLGLADRFVTTSDSVTMQVEVARLGRPLAIFELPPVSGGWLRGLLRGRDLGAIPRELMSRGLAVRVGEPFRAPRGALPDELPRVVERLRALLPAPGGPAPPGAGRENAF